jgi:plastocyanin
MIQIVGTSVLRDIVVKNVTAIGIAAAVPTFLKIAGPATNIQIVGNVSTNNTTKLIDDQGVTGAGMVQCSGNVSFGMPALQITPAATITIPLADEDHTIELIAGGTITEINGVTAKAGVTVTFLCDVAVTFSTSTSANNKIGRSVTTTGGQLIRFKKYITNGMWYPFMT